MARIGRRYQAVLPGEPGETDPPHGAPVRWVPPGTALWPRFLCVCAAMVAVSLVLGPVE